ncbi:hypothetical protein PMN64_00495 [Bradyrhizobium sp. UFLA01-814]|uniref:hypothetical protein n=1 Tax=Bradyrhizobium sp. UFLA01-814 TaxID=3023480 RepID=UPI00398AC732
MKFSEFKHGPARHLFAGLGGEWLAIFDGTHSFEELRFAIIDRNDKDVGRFVRAIRRYAGFCSSGEFRLLLAVAAFADFGHVADDLSGNTTWQNITRGCDADYRAAIAACVMAAP